MIRNSTADISHRAKEHKQNAKGSDRNSQSLVMSDWPFLPVLIQNHMLHFSFVSCFHSFSLAIIQWNMDNWPFFSSHHGKRKWCEANWTATQRRPLWFFLFKFEQMRNYTFNDRQCDFGAIRCQFSSFTPQPVITGGRRSVLMVLFGAHWCCSSWSLALKIRIFTVVTDTGWHYNGKGSTRNTIFKLKNQRNEGTKQNNTADIPCI